MKKMILMMAVALPLLFQFSNLNAQAAKSTVFTVQTRYVKSMMDSTERAALGALLQEYHTKVTMKNELVLSEKTMWHFWTDDSREVVTITEYADWSAIEKAGDRDDELMNQAWPDSKQRAEFNKKLNSYFSHHKDAIFTGLPKLSK
jgi:chromosome condensin MukBEF ATPase and DNA-binding subunit MukB